MAGYILVKIKKGDVHDEKKQPTERYIDKGALLIDIPTDERIPREDGGPSHNYTLYTDPRVTLYDDGTSVLPLHGAELDYLAAIRDPMTRFFHYNKQGKLPWIMDLQIGNIVYFWLPSKSATTLLTKGKIKYYGPIPDNIGVMFGLEIMDPQCRGEGTTDGSPHFKCGHNNAVYVAMDQITKKANGLDNKQSKRTKVRGSKFTAQASEDTEQEPPASNITESRRSNKSKRKKERATGKLKEGWEAAISVTPPPHASDDPSQFSCGDHVVLQPADGSIVRGIIRWAGPVRMSREAGGSVIPVVGIETSRPVDHEREFPGLTYTVTGSHGTELFQVPYNHGRIFVAEQIVLSEEEYRQQLDDSESNFMKFVANTKESFQREGVSSDILIKELKALEDDKIKLVSSFAELSTMAEGIIHSHKKRFEEQQQANEEILYNNEGLMEENRSLIESLAQEVEEHSVTKTILEKLTQEIEEHVETKTMLENKLAQKSQEHWLTKTTLEERLAQESKKYSVTKTTLQSLALEIEERRTTLEEKLAQESEEHRVTKTMLEELQRDSQQRDNDHKKMMDELEEKLAQESEEHWVTMTMLEELQMDSQQRDNDHKKMMDELEEKLAQESEEHSVTKTMLEELQRDSQKRDNDHKKMVGELEAKIKQFEQNWRISNDEIKVTSEQLGRGAWGGVVVGMYREDRVAVKQLHDLIVDKSTLAVMNREINTMSRLRHPNLLLFIGAVLDHPSGNPLIITEIMNTSLRQAYEKGQLTEETSKLSILRDTASGLNYLHCHHDEIIHRDVSSSNVLLESRGTNKWRAKLSDFGSANIARNAFTQAPGAQVYSAPEALVAITDETPCQTTKMDVYSYGILTCEVMSCRFPDHGQFKSMLVSVQANFPSIGRIVCSCTMKNPSNRPTMTQIIKLLQ